MAKPAKGSQQDGATIKALLLRYACPVPHYQVRARFMGNITSPDMNVSPMQEIQRIWNGGLPEFETHKEAEAFFDVLLQGMWNGLSSHQKRTDPFKLVQVKNAPASYEFLARLGKVRREEIEGFIDGLFAGKDEMDFPETAHKSIGILGELRAMFAATEELATNRPGPASLSSLEQTAKHLREMTRIVEIEINAIIQSCRKARMQILEAQTMERPASFH